MAVFWDSAPRSLVEIDGNFRRAYCLHHYRPDDGGSKLLSNTGQFLPATSYNDPEGKHFYFLLCNISKIIINGPEILYCMFTIVIE
jgi:hypothetical protein